MCEDFLKERVKEMHREFLNDFYILRTETAVLLILQFVVIWLPSFSSQYQI